jgi:hypothetical protein
MRCLVTVIFIKISLKYAQYLKNTKTIATQGSNRFG